MPVTPKDQAIAPENPYVAADRDGLEQAARFKTLEAAGRADEFMVTFVPENEYHQRMRASFERAIAVQKEDGSLELPEGIERQDGYYLDEQGHPISALPHTILYLGVNA